MNLSDLPEGTRVFVDANIFIHHFEEDAAVGPLCTGFPDRIAGGALEGFTSVNAAEEVVHRSMIAESVRQHGIPPRGIVTYTRHR